MENKKIIAMMLTLSMLAAAFAGCLGGDDEEPEPEDVMGCMDATANNYNADATSDDGSCTYDATWSLTPAAGVSPVWVASDWDPRSDERRVGKECSSRW